MTDPSRKDSIERWVRFVKENPDKWKKIHTQFINAQYEKHFAFIDRLLKTPSGKQKFKRLYKIQNENAFPNIFRKNQK